MVSLIQTGLNWSEDSAHLACSHAAVLNENDFILDKPSDQVKPKEGKEHFLKKVEDNLDTSESLQVERFQEMERLILEQMKNTLKKKTDSRGAKRDLDNKTESTAQTLRVDSPPKA